MFAKDFFIWANKTLMKSIMCARIESIETYKDNEIKPIDRSRWEFVYRLEEALLASSEQIERKNIDGNSPQDINLYWFMLIDEFLFQIIASLLSTAINGILFVLRFAFPAIFLLNIVVEKCSMETKRSYFYI